MEYYFITGTSKGIGKALAEELLLNENVIVAGIARHQTIEHPNYRHLDIDLANLEMLVKELKHIFIDLKSPSKVVLVNNAGVLGEIGYVGEKQPEDFVYAFNVNVTAPAILTNAFLQAYAEIQVPHIILNISSGAGKNPLDGWSAYCASKAALDMFSEVVQKEQNLRGTDVKVFSIAPGIVDTEMQTQIRQAPEDQFSQLDRFKEYKTSGSLADARTVAKKLVKVLNDPPLDRTVIFRLPEA